MKVVCSYLCEYRDRNDYFISLMPSGVPSIAAFLERGGHDVTLANLSQYGAVKGAEITLRTNPGAVTVSIFSFNRHESLRYIRELKKRKKDLIIIAGGQHPTFLFEEILSACREIDYIVRGEGETAVAKILDCAGSITKGPVLTEERISDLDSIPAPSDFSGTMIGVNPHEQFRYIITTRGCPSSCRYCSSPNFWERKVTYRSPANIVQELISIQRKYGIIYFSIRDDNFTLNKKRVLEFCRLLNESGIYMMWNCQARVDTIDFEMLSAMKSCGLEHIQFGVESGSEKILKLYDKLTTPEKILRAAEATRRAGVYLSFYLMAGMDGETEEDIESTVTLLHKALPHDVIVSPVAYYPGTAIYNTARDNGNISDRIWEEQTGSGLYLRESKTSSRWIKKILSESGKVSVKALYRERDFHRHRIDENGGFWRTDLLEGDYLFENGEIKKAAALYRKVISRFPSNIWGYIKTADALALTDPPAAIKLLKKASDIVPSYHGTFLAIARIELESGRVKEAFSAAQKAMKLNPADPETAELIREIKSGMI